MYRPFVVQKTVTGRLTCVNRPDAAGAPWFAHPNLNV